MKIRVRKLPSGKKSFILDIGGHDRRRPSFKKRADAEAELSRLARIKDLHGSTMAGLTSVELAEIVTAKERLRSAGMTISEAAEFAIQHGKAIRERLLLPELVRRFLLSREEMQVSTIYGKMLRSSLGDLAKTYPTTPAHELTPSQVKAWNKREGWGWKARNNYLGYVSAMYEWAMAPTQGFARVNPCVGVERDPRGKNGNRASLTVQQAQELLRAAQAQENWRVLAYVVLGMLCGIRPDEMQREGFTWACVSLDDKTVRLSEAIVKTGPGRVVDLTEQAASWLRLIPAELRTGPVIPPKNWRMVWLRFRYDLGWRVASDKVIRKQCLPPIEAVHSEWPADVLRHTYASYHYAQHQNANLLAAQMGHTSARMIEAHYRAIRTRAEAGLFWSITPNAPGEHLGTP